VVSRRNEHSGAVGGRLGAARSIAARQENERDQHRPQRSRCHARPQSWHRVMPPFRH
jgi:hypothetical protein